MGLELVHLMAALAVASMDSLVVAYLDDLAVNMVQMVAAVMASFDEHLVDRADEAFLCQFGRINCKWLILRNNFFSMN